MLTVNSFIGFLESQLGKPYVFGGASPSVGFDCSGLIYWAAGQCGVIIPRSSETQWSGLPHIGSPITGDLIFFDVPSDHQAQPAHVGVYLSPNLMIEAPHTGEDVKYSAIPNNSSERIMGYARIAFAPTSIPPAPPPNQIIKPLTGRFGMLNAPIVAAVPTWSGRGYTLVAADGGTFNYGDAPFLGSLASQHLNAPIVDAARTPSGNGLVLAATDGGVFNFGDSPFEGSEGGKHLNAPVISIGLTPTGRGYWLIAADGGVFTFGDAPFAGSAA